ncbi:ligand-gated TonB-dependent outer membrane channel [Geomonas limicola]|uniref:Ligand-gated TonB-dependent outer membrane channel n=1 Tax=Geomonas limicola TaxID=2740186 RepID=A0A6V8NF26_9BACT|nr:TonB-dependent receptor [Geomonas limicola]GFO69719.1 ligand-gated TonB-dependent outer membrane channel [Geomonas limicola]
MKKCGASILSITASTLQVSVMMACWLSLAASPAFAEDEDQRSLELYNGSASEFVSANRSPRPASQTAENITVVTAQEIEALNAHTLADILTVIPGIQLEMLRTPGTVSNFEVQGSSFNHVLVLIDNIPINNLSDNFPDISAIPAQLVDRVEIVKGAASTSWGSALGGVVNVITKSPQQERPVAGQVSGSLGRRGTADTRAELSGMASRLGYYLSGGNLRSDGLVPNNSINQSNLYGKVAYDLPVHGVLGFSTLYLNGSSGQFALYPYKADQHGNQLLSNLSLSYPISDHLNLEAALKSKVISQEIQIKLLDNTLLQVHNTEESSVGGSASLSWVSDLQRVVAGVDYDHAKARLRVPQAQQDLLNRSADRVGIYLNDTFTIGNLALTPSVRYDHTGTGDDLFNPSFGVTYALTDNSVLRGYTSRGYSITSLNQVNAVEEVWTSQIGFESGDIPYLWMKGTLFRNDTWNVSSTVANPNFNASDPTSSPTLNIKRRILKKGGEVELRTTPVMNTSLSAGYTFIDAHADDTPGVLPLVPRHTVKLGIKYQDQHNFRVLLTGSYIDWNGDRSNGKYDDFVWDLHLAKKFSLSSTLSLELFASVRNIFDGESYVSERYKNPGAWAEAGVRCNF